MYYTVSKFRGAQKGISKLIEEAANFAGNSKCFVALMNGGAAKVAAEIKPRIEAAIENGKIIMEKQITGTMAIHTGPGLLGIGVFVI